MVNRVLYSQLKIHYILHCTITFLCINICASMPFRRFRLQAFPISSCCISISYLSLLQARKGAVLSEVAHAKEVLSATCALDSWKFFELYVTAPKLCRAVMDEAVESVRFQATRQFATSYRCISVPISCCFYENASYYLGSMFDYQEIIVYLLGELLLLYFEA